MTLRGLAEARRTHKAFGPEPVPRETLLELLALASLAPNHHLTQPWRFRVLGPEALAALQAAAGEKEAAKLERAPTLVVASAALSGDLVSDEEDVCATAAAIMLVLLGATERGLASYWRTPAVLRTPEGREIVGLAPDERVVGVVYLGRSSSEPPLKERAPLEGCVEYLA